MTSIRIKQTLALIRISMAGVLDRAGSAIVVAVSVGCAAGILVSMLSIGAGIRDMTVRNVRGDRAIATAMEGSMVAFTREKARTIAGLPGIRKSAEGNALASADAMVSVKARRASDGAKSNLTIVGMGAEFQQVYPEIRVTDGRAFRAGMREVMVGENARGLYRGLNIGDRITYQGTQWQVVGAFAANGGLAESWLLTDAQTLMTAFDLTGYHQMTIRLESPSAFSTLAEAMKHIPALGIKLEPESEVREREARSLSGMVNFLSYFIGSIMAAGAMMGALNSMYAMIEARRRDFATLRALGFRSTGIATAVLTEAIMLAAPGAIIGALIPWLIFNGNPVTFVGLNFSLAVSWELVAIGVLWAMTVGVAGGIIPAANAARTPIATGLRLDN